MPVHVLHINSCRFISLNLLEPSQPQLSVSCGGSRPVWFYSLSTTRRSFQIVSFSKHYDLSSHVFFSIVLQVFSTSLFEASSPSQPLLQAPATAGKQHWNLPTKQQSHATGMHHTMLPRQPHHSHVSAYLSPRRPNFRWQTADQDISATFPCLNRHAHLSNGHIAIHIPLRFMIHMSHSPTMPSSKQYHP